VSSPNNTPHWFHIWFYRYVRGEKMAGRPGHPPFPTFFHPLVTLSKLEAFAERQGLRMIYRREYESPRFPEMRARKPVLARRARCRCRRHEFSRSGQGRRAARRLSRHFAKTLIHERNAVQSQSGSKPLAGDAPARRPRSRRRLARRGANQ